MPSLDQTIEELRQHLKSGRSAMDSTGHDPVYYLVYSPDSILEMRARQKILVNKLKNDGYDVHILSMADTIQSLLDASPEYAEMLAVENDPDISVDDINDSVCQVIADASPGKEIRISAPIVQRFLEAIESAAAEPKGLLLITDLEALHPYLKIGGIENTLVNKFKVPTVVLYPGEKTGSYSLKFLGVHVTDGNYRSIHLGG